MLIDSALSQCAEELSSAPRRAAEFELVTDAVRAAWSARDAAATRPQPFARSLFESAEPAALASGRFERERVADPDPLASGSPLCRGTLGRAHPAACAGRHLTAAGSRNDPWPTIAAMAEVPPNCRSTDPAGSVSLCRDCFVPFDEPVK
jgi:hypothetical protein